MSIDQVNRNSFSSRTPKSNSTSKAGKVNDSETNQSKETSNRNAKQADSLSLSGSEFANEVEFTKSLLNNTRNNSLESLKSIKQNIDTGSYDSKAVREEIGARIEEELTALQPVFAQTAENNEINSTISTEQKEYLLKNPEVTQNIADNIITDLQDL